MKIVIFPIGTKCDLQNELIWSIYLPLKKISPKWTKLKKKYWYKTSSPIGQNLIHVIMFFDVILILGLQFFSKISFAGISQKIVLIFYQNSNLYRKSLIFLSLIFFSIDHC
jgi:hypothetical protein